MSFTSSSMIVSQYPSNPEPLGPMLGRNEPGKRVFQPAADGCADLGRRRLLQPKLLHHMRIAPVNGRKVIDERAVEVKKEGAKRMGSEIAKTFRGRRAKKCRAPPPGLRQAKPWPISMP